MKKIIKVFAYGLLVLIIAVAGLLAYIKTFLPNVGPAPDINVERSAENIVRGKYLANHVMLCMDCHSTRDWSRFSGPLVPGTEGMGGEVFDQTLGFPGRYVAPNITPYALQQWTDGELFRAITSGVARDGRALFSIMPHHNYGQLDERDIYAVMAYIRTLEPIAHTPEKSTSDFPMNFIINTIPRKPSFAVMPAITDRVNYGKYLVTAAGCMDCHTRQEQGKFVGEPFAGGMEFRFRDGSVVRSSNLTPDRETGLGNWTSEQFVNRFKMYADSTHADRRVSNGAFQTVMPWTMYAGMTTDDLSAMFAYLQTLSPVNQRTERFSAPQ